MGAGWDNALNIFVLTPSQEIIGMYKYLFLNHNVYQATTYSGLITMIRTLIPDVVLLDLDDMETTATKAISKVQNNPLFKNISVIYLSSDFKFVEETKKILPFNCDILFKSVSPVLLMKRVRAYGNIGRRNAELSKMNLSISDVINFNLKSVKLGTETVVHDVIQSFIASCMLLVGKFTSLSCPLYLETMWEELRKDDSYKPQLQKWNTETIDISQLHDIGKMGISGSLLNKISIFNEGERSMVEDHVAIGEKILDQMIQMVGDSELTRQAKLFVGTHHERWDGTGYPNGLFDTSISLEGRILAIVDVYDALTSSRTHKEPMTHELAREIIFQGAGTQFDPNIVKSFENVAPAFKEILISHPA